uniref:RRM domain-containing protein n=1 Tax=Chromera velia CCMP2878 TaxID=1169474 RepID=A0A0G4GAP8_9ALVE|eukprot:Cvel_21029.t1-p1 / transcript=Cvel_21029.t1 / gene=Cvel_21029 / organism=Chromera_velia_CCMP2878 / gene_product=hypothetical protein / transcript_product=hypothetical protein / location=Cvel_scaffold1939:13232-20340(+) / protein_length=706 / sequence_SO=supercontig / SO=protein_coding / is_pseudo=false
MLGGPPVTPNNTDALFFNQIPLSVTEQDLIAWCSQGGQEITRLRLIRGDLSRTSQFAFVHYKTPEDARAAFQLLKDCELEGKKLYIEFQDPSRDRKRPKVPGGPPLGPLGGVGMGVRPTLNPNQYPSGYTLFLPEGEVQLQVSYLRKDTQDSELRKLFEEVVRPVLDVKVMQKPDESLPEGVNTFAFIQVASREDGDTCINTLDGKSGLVVRFSNAYTRTWAAEHGIEPRTKSGLFLVVEVTAYGVPEGTTSAQIVQAFTPFGEVEKAELADRGRVYVRFKEQQSTARAVNAPEGIYVNNHKLWPVLFTDPVQRPSALAEPPVGPPMKRGRYGEGVFGGRVGAPGGLTGGMREDLVGALDALARARGPSNGHVTGILERALQQVEAGTFGASMNENVEAAVRAGYVVGRPRFDLGEKMLISLTTICERFRPGLLARRGGAPPPVPTQGGTSDLLGPPPFVPPDTSDAGPPPPPQQIANSLLQGLHSDESPPSQAVGPPPLLAPSSSSGPAPSSTMVEQTEDTAGIPAGPSAEGHADVDMGADPSASSAAGGATGNVEGDPAEAYADTVWEGNLTRSAKKKVRVVAKFVKGNVRRYLKQSELLNIAHRSSYEEVKKRYLLGVCVFECAEGQPEKGLTEYINYFREKERAGVVQGEGGLLINLVPPSVDLFSDVGPLPTSSSTYLLGVLATSTNPNGQQAQNGNQQQH